MTDDSLQNLLKTGISDITETEKNFRFYFKFKEKVPYKEYQHKVMVLGEVAQLHCKNASFIRLFTPDKKHMVAMEIYCFNLYTAKDFPTTRDTFALLATKIQTVFKEKLNINAEFEVKESGYFSKTYKEFLSDKDSE